MPRLGAAVPALARRRTPNVTIFLQPKNNSYAGPLIEVALTSLQYSEGPYANGMWGPYVTAGNGPQNTDGKILKGRD